MKGDQVMKKKMLLALGVCAFIICGCGPTKEPQDPVFSGDMAPMVFFVYKFKNPSYSNYVLAREFDDYYAVSPSDENFPCGYWENMKEKNPFIPLQEEYFLLDWRWNYAFSCDAVLIFLPWAEQQAWAQHWDKDCECDKNPIAEEYECVLRDFDEATNNLDFSNVLRYCPYVTYQFSPDYQYDVPENMSDERLTEKLTEGMELEEVEAYYDAVYADLARRLDSLIVGKAFPLHCMQSLIGNTNGAGL